MRLMVQGSLDVILILFHANIGDNNIAIQDADTDRVEGVINTNY